MGLLLHRVFFFQADCEVIKCAATFVGYGHSLCRQHAACREIRGDLRLWNPARCDVCLEMVLVLEDGGASQSDKDRQFHRLKNWAKGFQRSRSIFLTSFRWMDLFPNADPGIVAPPAPASVDTLPGSLQPPASAYGSSSFEGFPDDASTHHPASSGERSASGRDSDQDSSVRQASGSSRGCSPNGTPPTRRPCLALLPGIAPALLPVIASALLPGNTLALAPALIILHVTPLMLSLLVVALAPGLTVLHVRLPWLALLRGGPPLIAACPPLGRHLL